MSTLTETAAELLRRLLPEPASDVLDPRPRVTPDPQRAAELARRCAALDYVPEFGFIRDHRQEKIV